MAEQPEVLETKTPSDGTSTSATRSAEKSKAKIDKKQSPTKADAFGILLSALSVLRTAGIEFEVASQENKAYLVIEAARWNENDAGLQIESI